MPVPRILALGGHGAEGALAGVDAFDVRGRRWAPCEVPLQKPRCAFAAVATPGGVLVLGGAKGSSQPGALRSTEAYLPSPAIDVMWLQAGECVRDNFDA